jgi:hypothetical protein
LHEAQAHAAPAGGGGTVDELRLDMARPAGAVGTR